MPEYTDKTKDPAPNFTEPVWTYRGYSIKASEFVTAMVHFFRAEITRSNVWRQRLDTTTNWAVVATGATISIAFSQPTSHHGVIILNTLLITWFLFIEARRYRYYELWSYRVRLMETDFFAAMLVPPFHPSADWAESLAENLLAPSFPISMLEAFGRRLRRNYFWIFLILGCSWLAKSWLFPTLPLNFSEFVRRSAVGPIPGEVILILGILYYGSLLLIAVGTVGMTHATGEILPRFGFGEDAGSGADEAKSPDSRIGQAWFRPHRARRKVLALIVVSKEKSGEIAQSILENMKRGVTSLSGKGMYTGEDRGVLMCALTVTEINALKSIVAKIDPSAFVITTSAHEVFGRGFVPLAED